MQHQVVSRDQFPNPLRQPASRQAVDGKNQEEVR
jgi:hypothetical protein